jgi:RNA polymerase sigma factor (sigma-70 family)
LEVPGKTLAAQEEGHPLEPAIRGAFAEIERQLEDHKASLRQERFWKRLARREEIRQRKAAEPSSEEEKRESFFPLVRPHLHRLGHFVRHVIAYAEATGDLIPGELAAEDVVDETLVRAYHEFLKEPARGEIRSWLIQLATDQLAADIKRLKSWRERTVRVEEDIPETPPAREVSTLGDEIMDFYQPDEDLKLEDVIPGLEVPTPEQIVETKELRQCVKAALAAMPNEWRRVLLLRYLRGLTGPELAEAVGRPEPEIDRTLEYAREHLHQKLVESGCSFKGRGSPKPAARPQI